LDIESIISYIEYLKKECHLSVSVHFSGDAFSSLPNELCETLLPYNSHNNLYCLAIKKESHESCIFSQKALRETLLPETPVCRTCFAGVSEYIFPVFREDLAIGFIAVSGYLSETSRDDMKMYLKDEQIPKKLCDTLILPLALMLEKLFLEHAKRDADEYTKILHFLNEYHTNISVSQIAEYFGRSVSHISHMFKSKSGMSVSEYCNKLRLRDAEKLLRKTALSVTEIALDVGFNDTSYFIRLFKETFKTSPLKYRKAHQKGG